MKDDDKNIKFFHAHANTRRGKILINGVQKLNWKWTSNLDDVLSVFVIHFSELFSFNDIFLQDDLFFGMQGHRTKANKTLQQPFSKDDIKDNLFSMHPSKAPSVSGMFVAFIQNHWHKVGDKVIKACLHFLNSRRVLEHCNYTLLALILKCKDPKEVLDFKPINLCTMLYKTVAKALFGINDL